MKINIIDRAKQIFQRSHGRVFRPLEDWHLLLTLVTISMVVVSVVAVFAYVLYAEPVPRAGEVSASVIIQKERLNLVLEEYAARAATFEELKKKRPIFVEP